MNPTPLELAATCCFFGALLHSFAAGKIDRAASRVKDKTLAAILHFAGEIEVVFGLWAALFVVLSMFIQGFEPAARAVEERSFHEAIFVFVIMVIAASRPVFIFSKLVITRLTKIVGKVVPIPSAARMYGTTLAVTPLLGSFITEPAAMTVAALLLKETILDYNSPNRPSGKRLLYSTMAILFVNISIGGMLTNFAAPPILMVAEPWNWDIAYLFQNFGWKAAIAVNLNAILAVMINFKALSHIPRVEPDIIKAPVWIQSSHLGFLLLAIISSQYSMFLLGVFLFFIGFVKATEAYQHQLKMKESLLVAFFLGGLIILTSEQRWWISPIIASLNDLDLYLGAAGLTAITDNAAITSLAAQVPDLPINSKHAVVAGALVGGGLTLIANAPNPAGYSILRDRFADTGGFNPFLFFVYALVPTLIAGITLWIL